MNDTTFKLGKKNKKIMQFFSWYLRPYISENINNSKILEKLPEITCYGLTFLLKTFSSKIILTLRKSVSEKKGWKLPNLGHYLS